MRFSTFAVTAFLAFAGFSIAMPSASTDAGAPIADAVGDAFDIKPRACRRLGQTCGSDRQCCNRECEHGRCRRHGGGGRGGEDGGHHHGGDDGGHHGGNSGHGGGDDD